MDFRSYLYVLTTAACVSICVAAPLDVLAQDDQGGVESNEGDESSSEATNEYVEPTSKQAALNSAAVGAIKSEEYEQAVKLLRRSLELGPMNITYLNLGRAHQRLGECGMSEQAYLEALTAPAVESPSPFLVEKKVEQYMGELGEECEEEDWEKTTSGSQGAEDGYSWEPESDPASPMLRLGVGVGYGLSGGFPGEGAVMVDGQSVADYSYFGGALRLEGTGGYFLNENIALHIGFVLNLLPAPETEYIYYDDTSEVRDEDVSPERVGFSRLSLGMTGYVPGDVFISGGVGLGFGRNNDPTIDVEPATGFALDLMLGKDFQINEQFAFGLGAYLDIVGTATNRSFGNTGVAIGLQGHGVIRLR